MQRRHGLQNISQRYGRFSISPETSTTSDSDSDVYTNRNPGGPITLRQPTDETDTESDTSSNSDETATDDGEEILTNPQVRAQRQAEARHRLDNTKQYLREYYDEAAFQTEVFFTVLGKLWSWLTRCLVSLVHAILQFVLAPLQRLFTAIDRLPQHIIDLAHRLYFFTVAIVNRIFLSTVDIVSRIFLFSLDPLTRMFFFTLSLPNRLLRGLLNLLRYLNSHLGQWIVYAAHVALRAAKVLLRLTIWILSIPLQLVYEHGELALKVIVFLTISGLALSPFVAVGFSLMRGYQGMINHACNDTSLMQGFTNLTGACDGPKLNASLRFQNEQLQELLNHSQSIINENYIVHYNMKLRFEAFHDLRDGVTGFDWFVRDQRENVSDPAAMDEIVEAMNGNMTFIGKSVSWFFTDYQVRGEELWTYLSSVLEGARDTKTDSAAARFWHETLYALVPSAFAQSNTARQVENYLRVARHFQNVTDSLLQFDDPGAFSEAVRAIARGYSLARHELVGHDELYQLPCGDIDPWGKYRCSQTAQFVVARFETSIPKALELAAVWDAAGQHHLRILRAFARLHLHLSGLLADAVARGKKVDPMSARAILRQFIVETGEVAVRYV